jgi:hypothetical protein
MVRGPGSDVGERPGGLELMKGEKRETKEKEKK